MQAEEQAMRKYLAELKKAEDEVSAVRSAVDAEREKLAQMKRQWLTQLASADYQTLQDVASLVSQNEDRVIKGLSIGLIKFGQIEHAVTAEDIMRKKAAIL